LGRFGGEERGVVLLKDMEGRKKSRMRNQRKR
jgi:hypothetical protein